MYCSTGDVLAELYLPLRKQVTDHFESDAELQTFLQQHVQRASDYIDSFLNQRYVTPIAAPVPSLITTITAKVAAYTVVANFSEMEETTKDKKYAADVMLSNLLKINSFPGLTRKSSTQLQGGSDQQVFTARMTREW